MPRAELAPWAAGWRDREGGLGPPCGHPQLAREVRRAMFSRGNRGARRLSRGSRETNQSQENTCRRPA